MSRAEPRPPAIAFVLVRPRNPNNIGAGARAIANFGFRELLVVDPHPPVWSEAREAAAEGISVLKSARAVSLDEALEGSHLILGTSDGRRALRQDLVPLPGLPEYLDRNMPRNGRLAILFGSEKTGLTHREIERCMALVRVPTDAAAPSMNLGQAVALVAYELSRSRAPRLPSVPALPPPTAEQREDLARRLLGAMDSLGYAANTPAAAKDSRVRRMIARWNLSRRDAALLQALLRRAAENVVR